MTLIGLELFTLHCDVTIRDLKLKFCSEFVNQQIQLARLMINCDLYPKQNIYNCLAFTFYCISRVNRGVFVNGYN